MLSCNMKDNTEFYDSHLNPHSIVLPFGMHICVTSVMMRGKIMLKIQKAGWRRNVNSMGTLLH